MPSREWYDRVEKRNQIFEKHRVSWLGIPGIRDVCCDGGGDGWPVIRIIVANIATIDRLRPILVNEIDGVPIYIVIGRR